MNGRWSIGLNTFQQVNPCPLLLLILLLSLYLIMFRAHAALAINALRSSPS